MTRRTLALTAAAFCLLSPAWADVTATVGMTGGQTLDLDTGALGTGTAADLLYTGFNGVLGPLGNGTGRRLALLLSFAEATAGAAAIIITVAYVREILHRGETEFTLLMAGVGLGSTVTAILIGRFTRPFEDGFRDGIDLHRRRHRWTVAALLLGGILLSAALV